MTSENGRLAEMKEAFDLAFTAARVQHDTSDERLITVRIGGSPFAFRLGDIASVEVGKRIVPIHGGVSGLLGIAGIRGRLVPVFGLAELLGLGEDAVPRWFATSAGDLPVGLGFGAFEGHIQVRRSELSTTADDPFVAAVVHSDGVPRKVIDTSAVLLALQARASQR